MAKTVITSTANSIKVVFNDDSIKVGMTQGTWRKDEIASFQLHSGNIKAVTRGGQDWDMHNSSDSFLVIDSVDAVAPSSLSDLYDKLNVLIA